MKNEFILEGLHCASCAAKIEAKLNKEKDFDKVDFSFTTMELDIYSDSESIRERVQKIVDSVEDGVKVVPKAESRKSREHHHHEHGECCASDHHGHHGHEHEHNNEGGRLKLILLIVSAVLLAAALTLHFLGKFELIRAIISVSATLLAGYDVIVEGVKSVFKRRIDETTLMTVAVVAAIALGEFAEGAAVMVLFGIGELLEDRAVEKSRRDIRKLADIRPDTAYLYENGSSREVRAEQVPVGAILEIPPHTRVPLDGVITEGSTTVDASSLTGESEPVEADRKSVV